MTDMQVVATLAFLNLVMTGVLFWEFVSWELANARRK